MIMLIKLLVSLKILFFFTGVKKQYFTYLLSSFVKSSIATAFYGILCMSFITVESTIGNDLISCILAASRMVDHWITNQRAQSGTSSPVRETESITPPAAKKNLKIQTTVSKDKPQTTGSHKTLSQRCFAFFIFYGES